MTAKVEPITSSKKRDGREARDTSRLAELRMRRVTTVKDEQDELRM